MCLFYTAKATKIPTTESVITSKAEMWEDRILDRDKSTLTKVNFLAVVTHVLAARRDTKGRNESRSECTPILNMAPPLFFENPLFCYGS